MLLLLLSVISVAAETDRATPTVTIINPAGNRISGAYIAVKSIATRVDVTTTSDGSGVHAGAPEPERRAQRNHGVKGSIDFVETRWKARIYARADVISTDKYEALGKESQAS